MRDIAATLTLPIVVLVYLLALLFSAHIGSDGVVPSWWLRHVTDDYFGEESWIFLRRLVAELATTLPIALVMRWLYPHRGALLALGIGAAVSLCAFLDRIVVFGPVDGEARVMLGIQFLEALLVLPVLAYAVRRRSPQTVDSGPRIRSGGGDIGLAPGATSQHGRRFLSAVTGEVMRKPVIAVLGLTIALGVTNALWFGKLVFLQARQGDTEYWSRDAALAARAAISLLPEFAKGRTARADVIEIMKGVNPDWTPAIRNGYTYIGPLVFAFDADDRVAEVSQVERVFL